MHDGHHMVSLIIPTLNEKASLPALFKRLCAVAVNLNAHSINLELIFVDDGSTDGTREALRKLIEHNPSIRLIERATRGLATAVVTGFASARGDVLGVMDADLSHPPELIPAMIKMLAGHDLVIGSRHLPGGGVEQWPWHRKLFSKSASALVKPLVGTCSDPMSGFFFVQRSVIQDVKLKPVGYKILLEILVKGHYQTIGELPYLFHNRDYGKSKLNWKVTLAYLWHIITLYTWKNLH